MASTYAPNEEVLNSSSRTKSLLLKSNIKPTEEQNLEFTYRYFDGNFGEIMPFDIIDMEIEVFINILLAVCA